MKFKIENIKASLAKLLTSTNFSLLKGQEVEVKPGVFVKLVGPMNFSVNTKSNGIEIVFKIAPQIRVDKFIQIYGDLSSVFIMADRIELRIDGLPDVTLEVIS